VVATDSDDPRLFHKLVTEEEARAKAREMEVIRAACALLRSWIAACCAARCPAAAHLPL